MSKNFKFGGNAFLAHSNILGKSEKLDLNALLICHRTASNDYYWTIHTLFIAVTTSCFEESALKCFQWSKVPVDFLSTKFTACSKLPSRDNNPKASYPRTQQRDQGAGWTKIKQLES